MMRFAKTDMLLGVMICAAAFLTYIHTVNFPFVPFTDAIWFLPQGIKFAQGEGLRNVYQATYLPDGAYVWHGFLLPLVLGGVFGTDTYIKVTFALAVLNAVNVVLLGAALVRLTSDWKLSSRLLFVIACLLTQVGFLQGVLGRPETLSSLLITCGLLAWSFRPTVAVYVALGVLTGLLAVTSPAPAVFAAGFLVGAILVREKRIAEVFKIGAILTMAALAAIAVAFWFYPYSLGQWIWGLQQHANTVIKDSDGPVTMNLLLQRFVISSGRFGSGLVFAFCWAMALRLVWSIRRERPLHCVLVAVVVLLVSLALLRMAFNGQFYYLLCLFPLAAGVAAVALHARSAPAPLLRFGLLLALALSSLDPLLLQAGRFFGYTGLPLPEARRLFAEDFRDMPGKVAVSMDLAVLSDTTDRLEVLYKYVPPCEEPDTDWLVTQQYCFFYAEPPNYANFKLVKNRFAAKQKLPGRLSQWFGVNGYGYAVYERVR
jgi:xanthosine utilization system XapX-like protein